MKTSFLNRWAGRALVLGALLLSGLFTACFDDTDILGRLDNLEKRVSELEANLKDQATTLQALSSLETTVNKLKTDVETNTGNITKNANDIADLLNKLNELSGKVTDLTGDVNDLTGNVDNLAGDLSNLTGKVNLSIEQITVILEDLQKAVEGLGDDVESLEAKDVALQDALDKLGMTVSKYEYDEATGIATVTLSGGQKFTVVTKDNAVDAVKVMKDEDGKYYWAVGGEFLKDANGKNIPISVTPEFKIDPDTRKVSVSVDGGYNWIDTGVVDEVALFSDVESDDDNVYLTLADGTMLTLPLSKEACNVSLSLSQIYVGYGMTETVEVEMTNVDKYIIVKPEGWRASVKDGVLSITAPAEGVGEAEGLVQMFTVAEDGHAGIFEIKVVAGLPEFSFVVRDYALGSTYSISVDDEKAMYLYGVAVLDETTTLESIYEAATENVTAADLKTGNQADLKLAAEELKFGDKYTVWVVLFDGDKTNFKAKSADQMITYTYERKVDLVFSDIQHLDAKVEFQTVEGEGDYYYYIQSLGDNMANFTAEELQQKVDAQIKSATSTSNLMSDGKLEEAGGAFLAWYKLYMGYSGAKFTIGHTIFVALVPKDNKDIDHVIYKLVTLKGYEINNQTTADVEIAYDPAVQTTTSVKATITPASGSSFLYTSTPLTPAEWEDLEGDDEALMKKIVGKGTGTPKTSKYNFNYNCSPGQTFYLVVYVFDENKQGKIEYHKLESPKVTYNEAIKLDMDVTYRGVNYVEATITATGGDIKSIRYGYMKKTDVEANADLKKDINMAEALLAVNKTITKRGNFNNANLAADNKYTIENLYFMEEQYLFVIAFDADGMPTHMDYELIDTKAPMDRFNASAVKPKVEEVYYYATSSTSGAKAAYVHDLSEWSKMGDVTDVTTLDGVTGSYWLDLDWSATGKTMKRMWLSAENHNNWKSSYVLTGTDLKADAASVIKNRAGYQGSGTAPDFYGRNTTTGALTIDPATVKVSGVSVPKTLRDKTVTPVGPKTIHLVWETTDGEYGYMTVVPETFAGKNSGSEGPGTDTDEPGTGNVIPDLASTPWGHIWLAMDEEEGILTVLDLGTRDGKVYYGMGMPGLDGTITCQGYTVCTSQGNPEVKSDQNGNLYLEINEDYRVYFSGMDKTAWTVTIWAPNDNPSAYTGGVGPETKTVMTANDFYKYPNFVFGEIGTM